MESFDIYQKVDDDFMAETTQTGGALSLVVWVVMLVMFGSELWTYMSVDMADHIVVDTTLDQKLPISIYKNFNLNLGILARKFQFEFGNQLALRSIHSGLAQTTISH